MAKKKVRRRAPKGSTLSAVTTADLAREMQRREASIGRLQRRRERLQEQIEEIDRELGTLGASHVAGVGRKRPKNEMKLADALVKLLTGRTMSVTEATEAVQEAGYRTSSSTFRTIVNQTLIKDSRFKKVARGQYTSKKG
ncbi:MAG: hypothetical protein AAFR38_11045 [Planctomycetota bacterium]